jgi:NAD(P)-dependent dehydrogenase (short-subunit alcohol dehydrogenase family)
MASLQELWRLDGRGAVVTGAARGIGRAITLRLVEAGASVVVADMDLDAAQSVVSELGDDLAGTAVAVPADVRVAEDLASLAEHAARAPDGLRIWVNNAGVFPPAHPVRADRETFDGILDVNVVGTHLGCQAAATTMTRGGVIVNVSSTAAFRGAGAYSASKWAVRGLTQGLGAHLGPQGIRVVGVAPTVVNTPGNAEVMRRGGEAMKRRADHLVGTIPLRRGAEPDDVARVVSFLVSDAASYLTGITIPVDGGELAV